MLLAAAVEVESYDACVLEEGAAHAGGTQVVVHLGNGVGVVVGKSRQEHLMNCRVTKPIETQSTLESYSSFYLHFLTT
ncbi:hypothetical protein MTR_3g111650 [Medicago truncatula]|uniref:Uncharacterized protein n=1 Tax=Medicago truncatula TaxID=3880 RepID=A0A072V385_MEDTR|nr:hypothetical protein MTR_3g111650 [Medicago truncatula]